MKAETLLVWVVAALILGLLAHLQRQKVSFGIRVTLAMILGLAFGAIFREQAAPVNVVGQIYVNLIRMLVMPLLFASITASFTRLSDPSQLGRLSVKTISIFLITTAIAAAVGLVVALAMDPAAGVSWSCPMLTTPGRSPRLPR